MAPLLWGVLISLLHRNRLKTQNKTACAYDKLSPGNNPDISCNIYAKINFKIICDTGGLEIIGSVIYCQYSMSELNYCKLLIMAEEIQTLNTSHSMLSGSKEQKTIQVL